jgi:hypothetical protein
MTVQEADRRSQEILLKNLKTRLFFCEDEIEEEYIKKEIERIEKKDQISPRDR